MPFAAQWFLSCFVFGEFCFDFKDVCACGSLLLVIAVCSTAAKVPLTAGDYEDDGSWVITDNWSEEKATLTNQETFVPIQTQFKKHNEMQCMTYDKTEILKQAALRAAPPLAEGPVQEAAAPAPLQDAAAPAASAAELPGAPAADVKRAAGSCCPFETPKKVQKLITAGSKPAAAPARASK